MPGSEVSRRGDACPNDDTLASHFSGALASELSERIAEHIDRCAQCRAVGVAFTRGTPPGESDTTERNTRFSEDELRDFHDVPSLPDAFAGRYKLGRLIGTGGMGTVYEALDLKLHRLVAIKVLRLTSEQPEERAVAANRLIREARAMATLSHRNVVAVYDVGTHDDLVFIALQLVIGTTLRTWLTAKRRTTLEILNVLAEAGEGLAVAHASRLVHRDFKPDNVLISETGTARVTDFGLARRADLDGLEPADGNRASGPVMPELAWNQDTVTRSGVIVGTPAYMAPEQARGEACDARADQFSYCVTAWEALYGTRPFAGATWAEIYANMTTGTITPPPNDASVPRAIQRALRRGLASKPDDRFESMPKLLAIFVDELKRPRRRRRGLLTAATATVAAVAAVLAMTGLYGGSSTATKSQPAPPPPQDTSPPPPVTPPPATPPPVAVIEPPSTQPPPTQPTVEPAKPLRVRPPHRTAPVPTVAADAMPSELVDVHVKLTTRWRGRGLLADDLTAGYRDAAGALDAALQAHDYTRAMDAYHAAVAAIDAIAIDYAFVNNKLKRLNAKLTTLPAARRNEYIDKLRALSASVSASDYTTANHQLDEIAASLGVE